MSKIFNKKLSFLYFVVVGILIFLLNEFIVQLIYSKSYLLYFDFNFVLLINLFIIYSELFFINVFCNNIFLSGLTVFFISFPFVFFNGLKLKFLTQPLVPADIGIITIKETIEILSQKNFILLIILLVIYFTAYFLIIYLYIKKHKYYFRKINFIIGLIVNILLIIIFYVFFNLKSENFIKFNNFIKYKKSSYNKINLYLKNGFWLYFTEEIRNCIYIPKPKNYNKENVLKTIKLISIKNKNNNDNKHKINIIVILVETFWDPMQYTNLGISPDPCPYYRSLKQKYTSGEFITPLHGGGTCQVDFEVNTGLSSLFVNGYAFNTSVNRKIPSLPYYFKRKNYYTIAIEPNQPWFFNKQYVMPLLGFDKYYNFSNKLKNIKHTWHPSDYSLFKDSLKILRNIKKPVYVYINTLGMHGPYDKRTIPKKIREFSFDISYPLKDSYKEKLTGYLQLLKAFDNSLKYFLENLKKSNKKYLVVFYGDHHASYLYLPFKLIKERTIKNVLKIHTQPLVFWSNFSIKKKHIKTSPNFLSIEILDLLDYKYDKYFSFIAGLHKQVPVFSKIIITKDKKIRKKLPDNKIYNNWVNAYNLIQYDILFGKNYSGFLNNF